MKHKPSWLAITGTFEMADSVISYTGKEPKAVDLKLAKGRKAAADDTPPTESLIRSDAYFESGDIVGEFRLSSPDLLLRFRLGSYADSRTTVGINAAGKTYGLGAITRGQGKTISTAGEGSQPPINEWTRFRVRVRGSQLEFFINDIRVVEGNVSIQRAQLEVLLGGVGKIELRNIHIESVRPVAFVVMQFSAEYTALYKDVIAPVCEEFGYQVIRGDNVYTNGLIIEDITRSIRECSIVIADITPNNANVYYEIGFAHGIGKQTILLSDRNREKLPFDISGFRLLFYDNTIGGKAAVEEALRKHLDAIRGA